MLVEEIGTGTPTGAKVKRKTKGEFLTETAPAGLERHNLIVKHIDAAGKLLLQQRESGDWKDVLDGGGLPYTSWSDYLERAFPQSRKHLIELMNAAPVREVLEPEGFVLGNGAANLLSKYPREIWLIAVKSATARYAKITESRLERVANVLQEAMITGHVSLDSDEMIALDAALDAEDAESAKRKAEYLDGKAGRYYVLKDVEAIPHAENGQIVFVVSPTDGLKAVAGSPVHLSIWLPKQPEPDGDLTDRE